MPRVEELTFAKLLADGKVYRAPCLVFRSSVDGRWWRKDGMAFSPEDFDAVFAAAPDAVVLGVGIMNKVSIREGTLERFAEAGIACEVMDSNAAAERFNALFDAGTNVVGAFHLM